MKMLIMMIITINTMNISNSISNYYMYIYIYTYICVYIYIYIYIYIYVIMSIVGGLLGHVEAPRVVPLRSEALSLLLGRHNNNKDSNHIHH